MAIAAGVLVALRDHRALRRYTFTAAAVGFGLLILPLVPGLGRQVYGSRIWIGLGPFSFQPGEIAKIALAVFFAGYLVQTRDVLSLAGRKVLGLTLPRARDLGPILVAWAASLGVLIFEKDLGSSLLFFGLFVAMLYVATERRSWIAIGLILFVAAPTWPSCSSATCSSASCCGSTRSPPRRWRSRTSSPEASWAWPTAGSSERASAAADRT